MQNLKVETFFNLSKYQHVPIFHNISFVWEALAKINSYLQSLPRYHLEIKIPENVYLVNRETISIGKNTIIEPGAYIKGPCVIGDNCVIRHGAYIRGNFICGNNCVIGHDTEIKNAIFLDHIHASHFAYIGDSILGNSVNLGAGTKCANLKFDNTNISISLDGQPISTALRKFGAIIGDNSQIGCNVVTNPGALIGKDVFCYPCVNVSGIIPSHSIVKNNAHQQVFTKAPKNR